MKIKVFLILFLSFSFIQMTYSQSKYLIYFKDKGIKENVLAKNSLEYKLAEEQLSTRTIERRKKVMGENYVTFEDLPVSKVYVDSLKKMGLKIQNELSWFNAVSAYLTGNEINILNKIAFIEKIEKCKTFKSVNDVITEKNGLTKQNSVPTSYGESLTQLEMLGIPVLHSKGITGKGVRLGVLDSGFDWKFHKSLLNAKVIAEYDFIFNDSVTADEPEDILGQESHGTAVLSTIAGFDDGKLIGAAYESEFVLAKTEDTRSEKHIEEDNYAAALIWMEAKGVDITSSSLGYSDFDSPEFSYTYKDMDGKTTIVTKAVEKAFDRGMLTITAAGNEGNKPWYYITAPADGFNVIGVGAVNFANTIASFSGRGPTYDGRIKPDLVAPGVSIFGANSFGYDAYSYNNGTSLACPLASGSAALLLSVYPHLTNVQMKNILLQTSDNYTNPNNEKGYGVISPLKAIQFPNLSKNNSVYQLNKIFIGNVKSNTVTLNLSVNGGKNFDAIQLQNSEQYRYNYNLTGIGDNKNLVFYYTYNDSMGENHREPASNYFQVRTSTNATVSSGNYSVPSEYILNQNFPNPFNNSTVIEFYAMNNEKAELVVLSSIGEKVKTLFSGDAAPGINTVKWDGYSDRGLRCASGVYYYLLKIGGKEFGKKMVLVK